MTVSRGPGKGRSLEKQPLSLGVKGLADQRNKQTCESDAEDQRSSVRELEENCTQSFATVLNGSQDLSEMFNLSTKEKKSSLKINQKFRKKAGESSLISGIKAQIFQVG